MNLFFIALLAVMAVFVSAGTLQRDGLNSTSTGGTCGGNCPGNDCNSCPCGSTKNPVDVASWCAKYSGWNQASCKCIVSHESGGNGNAVNYNAGQSASYLWDVGLWQVNSYNWNSCSGGAAPCDLTTNLNCAKKVFQWGGNTWKLWSTCSACGVCNSA